MANGVSGENILLALRRVELEDKLEPVLVVILSHLKEEHNARDQLQNQRNATFNHVQVRMV